MIAVLAPFLREGESLRAKSLPEQRHLSGGPSRFLWLSVRQGLLRPPLWKWVLRCTKALNPGHGFWQSHNFSHISDRKNQSLVNHRDRRARACVPGRTELFGVAVWVKFGLHFWTSYRVDLMTMKFSPRIPLILDVTKAARSSTIDPPRCKHYDGLKNAATKDTESELFQATSFSRDMGPSWWSGEQEKHASALNLPNAFKRF